MGGSFRGGGPLQERKAGAFGQARLQKDQLHSNKQKSRLLLPEGNEFLVKCPERNGFYAFCQEKNGASQCRCGKILETQALPLLDVIHKNSPQG